MCVMKLIFPSTAFPLDSLKDDSQNGEQLQSKTGVSLQSLSHIHHSDLENVHGFDQTEIYSKKHVPTSLYCVCVCVSSVTG